MQSLIRNFGIMVGMLFISNHIYAQYDFPGIPQTQKSSGSLYRTNNLLVINDSLLYDFDPTTAIPFPKFHQDSLIHKSKRITVTSSKKEMKALGYDTLYSAIYFIKVDKDFIDYIRK
ncbi:MAG: hypothetical protein M9904_09140 [Chitinophagaceae bacterium]|nr:hypothetical protein [Chitinophagaceae bacterium]